MTDMTAASDKAFATGFNANKDAERLHDAMKVAGKNDEDVIIMLVVRTNAQRQQIAHAFKTMYGKELNKALRDDLTSVYEELVLALMREPAQYDAEQLRKAMKGVGTTESVLIEIMCSRTNAEINAIRDQFKTMYNRDLEKDLRSETSGPFKKLLVSLCTGGRDESDHVDEVRANQDAKKLYSAGELRSGVVDSFFNAILAAQSYAQLRAVFVEYEKASGRSITIAIEKEFSGDFRDALLAIIKCVNNRPAFFAELLHNSIKDRGITDSDTIRIIVSRSEADIVQICHEFQKLYKRTFDSYIQNDAFIGKFEKVLGPDMVEKVIGVYKTCLRLLIRGVKIETA